MNGNPSVRRNLRERSQADMRRIAEFESNQIRDEAIFDAKVFQFAGYQVRNIAGTAAGAGLMIAGENNGGSGVGP